jgi:sugar phosphate isomerase/epimerase
MIAEATLAELAAIGRGEGLGFSLCACSTVNAATRLAELRTLNDDTMERILDVCGEIGSTVLCIHPGTIDEFDYLGRQGLPFPTERFDREDLLREGHRRAVEAITGWADLAAPIGVTIVVENDVHVPHTTAPTAESLAAMVTAAERPNIKVNFDTGHAFIGAGLLEELDVIKPHIGHFHLDDNSTPRAREHLPLGEGAVNFPSIAEFLATADAAHSLEIYAPDRPVEATLASRDYILGVIASAGPPATAS